MLQSILNGPDYMREGPVQIPHCQRTYRYRVRRNAVLVLMEMLDVRRGLAGVNLETFLSRIDHEGRKEHQSKCPA